MMAKYFSWILVAAVVTVTVGCSETNSVSPPMAATSPTSDLSDTSINDDSPLEKSDSETVDTTNNGDEVLAGGGTQNGNGSKSDPAARPTASVDQSTTSEAAEVIADNSSDESEAPAADKKPSDEAASDESQANINKDADEAEGADVSSVPTPRESLLTKLTASVADAITPWAGGFTSAVIPGASPLKPDAKILDAPETDATAGELAYGPDEQRAKAEVSETKS